MSPDYWQREKLEIGNFISTVTLCIVLIRHTILCQRDSVSKVWLSKVGTALIRTSGHLEVEAFFSELKVRP